MWRAMEFNQKVKDHAGNKCNSANNQIQLRLLVTLTVL
jgi:hypothetical protein